MTENRYAFLDAIRGLAAMFVVIRHTEIFWGVSFFRSYLAVDVFFLLSGFVIVHAYEKRLASKMLSNAAFFKLRLIRLYPVFALSVFFAFIAFYMSQGSSYISGLSVKDLFFLTIPVLFFLPSNYSGQCNNLYPVNTPYWSLLDEILVNVIYASIRTKLNTLILCCCISLSGLGLAIIALLNNRVDAGYQDCFSDWGGGFFRAMFGFFVGVALYRFKDKFLFLAKNSIYPWMTLLLVSLVFTSPSIEGFDVYVDLILIGLLFPVLVIIAAQGRSIKSEKLLLIMGSVSYPIYVFHIPLANMLTSVASYSIKKHSPISGFVFFAALIILSLVVEKIYDIPLRKYFSRRVVSR
ncbi:MAG: acyltransferase [Chitinophagaceae bacterium]|nr:MAG: acyltransferase [Chitinophagaceae bacterium]